jgi:hypothetical protein
VLQASRTYAGHNGIPDFYVDEPDRDAGEPLSSDLDPVAALPKPRRTACMELRQKLHLPHRWPQDLFELRDYDHRRGFWPNEQLVPRGPHDRGFCWTATGNDPWVVTPCLLRPLKTVELEMRVHSPQFGRDDLTGQIFWKDASHHTFTEECSVKFDLINDGEVHRMKVDLTASANWPAVVEWLRFDLSNEAGEVDLHSVRLR